MPSEDNPKIQLIVDCALALLRDEGSQGLTMRKVAARAGMSLSNVQYYFKSRDALVTGMVSFYCEECLRQIENHVVATEPLPARERVSERLSYGLAYGEQLTELCKIFREFWAIAGRDQEVESHLNSYYVRYADLISGLLSALSSDQEAVARSVGLLVPYFEGYSITASATPIDRDVVAEMLTALVCEWLDL